MENSFAPALPELLVMTPMNNDGTNEISPRRSSKQRVFWDKLIEGSRANKKETAKKALDSAVLASIHTTDRIFHGRLKLINRVYEHFSLDVPVHGDAIVSDHLAPDQRIEALPGVSLVTACMDRNENLIKGLRTWLNLKEISEIIIVDWSSDIPVIESLSKARIDSEKIKVVRIDREPRWVLSWAFNLGFKYAQHTKILKVDADITIHPSFFTTNVLKPGTFICGDWRQAQEASQVHINGFFYCWGEDLEGVQGFNEFIQSYGWDDDDLYSRLVSNGVKRIPISGNSIRHLDHSDEARVAKQKAKIVSGSSASLPFETDLDTNVIFNKKLSQLLPQWGSPFTARQYKLVKQERSALLVSAIQETTPVIPDHYRDAAQLFASYESVSWRLGPQETIGIPPDKFQRAVAEKTLSTVAPADMLRGPSEKLSVPKPIVVRPKLYINAQHGLGNRLRAIASANSIAQETGAELMIIWVPDEHCEARFSDLFDFQGEIIEDNISDKEMDQLLQFNYMEAEGGKRDLPIDIQKRQSVYVKSAYSLNHSASSWEVDNRFLHSLTPSPRVLALTAGISHSRELGVHVRMEGGKGYEQMAYESSDNWTDAEHNEISKYRSASHYSAFFKRIDKLADTGISFFLAADQKATYEAFRQRYGERVQFLRRDKFDRSPEQIIYALSDVILLSQNKHILGSGWSSFTELATRLALKKVTYELSGKDF